MFLLPTFLHVFKISVYILCFSSILSNFRKHFNDILANKPANPPDFDVYEDMIDKKAEEAKKAIDNTAGASDADKQKAKDEVNYLNTSILGLHKPLFYDFIRCPQ